ncbi:uncharacterized protein LOC143975971 [Lithobates pipiens]
MRPHADMNALNLDTYGLSLITAKEDILNERISTDWAVFTYEKKWSLKLMDSGVGGLEELIKKFNKNLVLYGLCRVPDPNTQGPRFILIYWVGENVDASRKEVSTQHLPAIRRFFKEASVMLRAQRIEDISQEAVTQALNKVPQPTRSFHRSRLPGSHDLVGTNYTKTNPAIEMKFSMRDSFWQRNEREEERRKEHERLRLQEERIAMEKARIERERLEEEDRERRIQEKEKMVEEQRKEQARLEAEQRRTEKARWAQQQKEFEEEMKGRFRRSQSIEMAAEAAALVSGRSMHPRDIFRQHERSVSCSNSPPSTPSSPGRSPSSFSGRTTFRYQRSVTESILTPPARSPSYFPGFQKRDSFSGPSSSTPPACSPAFIFSKAPLPGTSTKMDSLPSFIPPPISTKRGSPSHVKENISPQSSISPPQSSISSPKSSISPPWSSIPPPQSSIPPPQSSTSPPQSSTSPPQSSTSPPQSSTSPPQSSTSPPQSSTSPPQSSTSPPQSSTSPPQSTILPPQSTILPPQSTISPLQSTISPLQSTISPLQSTISPLQSTISPLQSSISPPQSSISPPQSSISPPQSSISPHQSTVSPQQYLYDVPYRAEYVTLTSEEPLQQGIGIKAQTRPPALNIPPSTNFDTPDATNTKIPGDVYRAEFVPVDSLNTSEDLADQGHSPKSQRSYHTPEGPPAAIKATVSISSPVSEIAFASVTPVTDAKISTTPLSTEAPGLDSLLSAKAIGPAFAPQEPVLAAQASSTCAASIDQRLLPSPPISVTAGKLPETKSNVYSINSYESHASSKTNVEGQPPSPLADSPITLEGKTPFSSSSLRSILQYVAPPPYTPFSARTTDSFTVKAPAFGKSLTSRSASISAGTLPGITSTNVPNLETLTVNSNQLKPKTLDYIETQEHNASCLSDHPPQSQIEVTNESADVQPVDLALASSSLATVGQPESQQAEVPTVDSLPRETSISTSQVELYKDQIKVSSNNLPEAKAEPIYNQIQVSSAENFPLSLTEPINIAFKIPSAETVSVINLPEPQVEADVPLTEVLPLSASLPTNNPPEFQAKPSEKQTDVSPVESLPVVASLYNILPEPQEELREKQLKVSPVQSLPTVSSLSSILPESQDELGEKQLRVSPLESLPAVASLCAILPEPQEELSEKQTEVSPVESLPVVASLSSILPESQDEVNEKQSEDSPVDYLPVVASLCIILPEPEEELGEKQTEVSPGEPLPVAASLSSILPESQDKLSEKQMEVSPVESLPVVAPLSGIVPETQHELIEKQAEVSPEDFLPVVASLCTILPEPQEELFEKPTEVSPVATFSGILSESQEEPIKQTEVSPEEPLPVVASLSSIVPESQDKLGEKQMEVSPVESLPVVASLSGIVPESQDELIEKQTEVSPEDFLPVVASLCTILPEPQEELSEKRIEVSPVAPFSGILSESQEEPTKKQTEVSPAAPFSGILSESQEEPIKNQTEVSPVESLPEAASLSRTLPEPQAEPSDFQTSLPILPTLPIATHPPINSLLGNQAEHIEKQVGIPPIETFPASAPLCTTIRLESQTDDIGNQTEGLPVETVSMDVSSFFQSVPSCNQTDLSSVETIPIPENLPVGGFNDSQLNDFVSGAQFDTFPVSLPTERSSGSEHTKYQSDVPSVKVIQETVSLSIEGSPESENTEYQSNVPSIEAIHEPVSLSTENSLKVEQNLSNDQDQVVQPQTSPVPFTLPKSEPSINQTKVSNNAAIQLADFLYTDSAPTSQAKDNIHQSKVSADAAMQLADFLYTGSSARPQDKDNINQIEVPQLPEYTSLHSDSSTGYQKDQMTTLTDCTSVLATIPHINSKEEPCKIQTEVPSSQSLPLPLNGSLDSQAKPIKEQIGEPPLEYLPVTASLTTNISCQSLGEVNQSELAGPETLPVSAVITTDMVSEPQADIKDRQPEIILSDIVVSLESQGEIFNTPTEVTPLQTLPVTDSLSTNSLLEAQTEPEDDRTEVPQVILVPDSSFKSEDEANQIEVLVPLSLPVSLPIESSSESKVHKPEEDIPVSFSPPVCSLPEPLGEIRDTKTELLTTEGKNEFPPFPPVIPAEVQAESYDGPSEVLPTENITESTPLPAIAQPETKEYSSQFPPIVSFPGSSSVAPDQLPAASSLENPEVLKPDTFIACMALCTDESAESNIEENCSQPSTETSFLPTSLPSNSSSEWSSELSQVPPTDPTSLTWLGDNPSTSLAWLGDNPSTSMNDILNAASSVESSLLSASFPTDGSVKFAADPNGNLIEVESLPVRSSLLGDGSSEFFPPPTCVDEAPLLWDSLPASSLNLFGDPHPGSPPVIGSLVEPYPTEEASGPEVEAISTMEHGTDKVIVHDILPINNLPAEESQTPKALSLCNTDLVNSSDSSAFVDHKHSTLIPTENALHATENNIPDNNNTLPSEVVL